MHFASLDYLIFLPVAVFAYWLVPRRARIGLIVACSLIFYGSWNWTYLPLLLGTVAFAWLGGLWMAQLRKDGSAGLGLVVIGLLVPLFLFKYYNWFAYSLETVLPFG